MLRHYPAKRIPAAAGRERKDDSRQRTGLAKCIARFRGQRQGGASGNKISAVHSLFSLTRGFAITADCRAIENNRVPGAMQRFFSAASQNRDRTKRRGTKKPAPNVLLHGGGRR
jgi:hypothetical protein